MGYGYHRDELYFRLLHPAWGYVDQPPLTPLLARLLTHMADEPWALRIPATLGAVTLVGVLVLVTREAGGGRAALTTHDHNHRLTAHGCPVEGGRRRPAGP